MSAVARLRRDPRLRRRAVRLRHRGLSSADAALASYPKSGNTWLKFMLGQLLGGNELDFDSVEAVIPNVGAHRSAPRLLPSGGRLVKTHEPFDAAGGAFGRVVYVVRDGRDVAVSYYFHKLRRGEQVGRFPDFLREFLTGRADGYGGWGEHVRSWLNSPFAAAGTLHVLRYEDVLAEPVAAVEAAATFLGAPVDPVRTAAVVAANAADRMRAKEPTSMHLASDTRRAVPFVREAAAGGWNRWFSDDDRRCFMSVYGDELELLGYADVAEVTA